MRAGEQASLEGQLTARAAESVANLIARATGPDLTVRVTEANVLAKTDVDVLALTGFEKVMPERRPGVLQQAAGRARQALVVTWRKHNAETASAQQEVAGWLGGQTIAPGISDEISAQIALKDATFSSSQLLEHGSLRWWQMAVLLDQLSKIPAPGQYFSALEKARTQLLQQASFLGRHGPATFCSLVITHKTTKPGSLSDLAALNPYLVDADEKLIKFAPILVEALQELYLTGYLRRRDLDMLLAERARLQQSLA